MLTPGGLAALFASIAAEIPMIEHECLERAATIIEKDAKALIGTYDAGWPPLQPETIARKSTGDFPVLETGELRSSIEHTVDGSHAYVGSNNEKAVWQFLGTSRGIPPRDPLVPAATRCEGEIKEEVGSIVYSKLIRGG